MRKATLRKWVAAAVLCLALGSMPAGNGMGAASVQAAVKTTKTTTVSSKKTGTPRKVSTYKGAKKKTTVNK